MPTLVAASVDEQVVRPRGARHPQLHEGDTQDDRRRDADRRHERRSPGHLPHGRKRRLEARLEQQKDEPQLRQELQRKSGEVRRRQVDPDQRSVPEQDAHGHLAQDSG
jgi:hypothetical protein